MKPGKLLYISERGEFNLLSETWFSPKLNISLVIMSNANDHWKANVQIQTFENQDEKQTCEICFSHTTSPPPDLNQIV